MTIGLKSYLAVLILFQTKFSQNTDLRINDKSDTDIEYNFIQKLNNYLFQKYKPNLKPPGVINIKFGLNLRKIVELNPQDETLTTNAWVEHIWIDSRLAWDPLDFGNTTMIFVASNLVWTPDTFIDTSSDRNSFLIPYTGSYIELHFDGYVFWAHPMGDMNIDCPMNVKYFPYDSHSCLFVFSSWSYYTRFLNYSFEDDFNALVEYEESQTWNLVEIVSNRVLMTYNDWSEFPLNTDNSFSEMHIILTLKRKPLYLIINFTIPSLILSILTIMSFFIPFTQQIQIRISIILAFSVLSINYRSDLPVQSKTVPLLTIYFLCSMIYSLCGIIWFSIIQSLRDQTFHVKIQHFLVFHASKLLFSQNLKNNLVFTYKHTREEENKKNMCFSVKSNSTKGKSVVIKRSVNDKSIEKEEDSDINIIYHSDLSSCEKSSKYIIKSELLSTAHFNGILLKILNILVFFIFSTILLLTILVILVIIPLINQ